MIFASFGPLSARSDGAWTKNPKSFCSSEPWGCTTYFTHSLLFSHWTFSAAKHAPYPRQQPIALLLIYTFHTKKSNIFSQIFVSAYTCFLYLTLPLLLPLPILRKQHGASPVRRLPVYSANARVHTILCGRVVGLSPPSRLRRRKREITNKILSACLWVTSQVVPAIPTTHVFALPDTTSIRLE